MIEFRQKKFSFISDVLRGAAIGSVAGNIGSAFFNKKYKDGSMAGKVENAELAKQNKGAFQKHLMFVAGGTVIGATLGALVCGIKGLSNKINNNRTVNNRLMKTVIEMLKKDNLKEGKDFTRDPKLANTLKTKVCVVITKISGELRISVNTVADNKLKDKTFEIIKRLPNSSAVTKNLTDKYNDITITSISDSSADAGLVVGIIENFIHSGYPVYLVEVG